jgi:hypothetical protein
MLHADGGHESVSGDYSDSSILSRVVIDVHTTTGSFSRFAFLFGSRDSNEEFLIVELRYRLGSSNKNAACQKILAKAMPRVNFFDRHIDGTTAIS